MFTIREVGDMLVSIVALGFLFSFSPGFLPEGSPWLMNLLMATLLSGVVWTLHVAAQKLMARRYECRTIYFMSPHFIAVSVLLTLFISVMSFGQFVLVVAAVGFVNVSTKYSMRLGYKFMGLTLKETGEVAVAGWIANVLFALLLKVLHPAYPAFFTYFIEMNLWVALFNLLPIPPLDGSKILSWNVAAWVVSLALSITLLLTLPFLGLIESLLLLFLVLVVGFFVVQRLLPAPTGARYAE
jgi:Zn-dependent protease